MPAPVAAGHAAMIRVGKMGIWIEIYNKTVINIL
jgi:hypothetical protein